MNAHLPPPIKDPESLELALDPSNFYLNILLDINETLNDVIGESECTGLIALVADKMGRYLESLYQQGLEQRQFDINTLAAILVDLKRRISGNFTVESISPTKIVLINSRCPFGDDVLGHPTLCMMTSNVFGRISANSLGYAAVELDKTIARGDGCCHVTVHLDQIEDGQDNIIEYFNISDL